MKKISAAVLTAVLGLALAGCAVKTQNTSSTSTGNKTAYKDGTYDIKTKSTKPGFEEAVVTIKDGKIQNVDLKRLDDSSKELNYDEWDGNGGKPNIKKARLDLAKAIVEKQSAQVDTVSGATESSKGWMKSVSDALAQASK